MTTIIDWYLVSITLFYLLTNCFNIYIRPTSVFVITLIKVYDYYKCYVNILSDNMGHKTCGRHKVGIIIAGFGNLSYYTLISRNGINGRGHLDAKKHINRINNIMPNPLIEDSPQKWSWPSVFVVVNYSCLQACYWLILWGGYCNLRGRLHFFPSKIDLHFIEINIFKHFLILIFYFIIEVL